jgi:hypothetical protein
MGILSMIKAANEVLETRVKTKIFSNLMKRS